MMMDALKWLVARGREPSTYAGLAGLLATLNIPHGDSWAKDLTMLSTGAFSVLAMFMSEKGV